MIEYDKTKEYFISIIFAILVAGFTIFFNYGIGRYIFLGLTIVILLLNTKGKFELSIEPYYLFNIVLIAFAALSMLWAWEPSLTKDNAKQLFDTFLCFALIYLAFSNNTDTKPLVHGFKLSGYIVLFFAIINYGIDGLRKMLSDAERMGLEIGNPNQIAQSIAYGCLFDFFEIAKKRRLTITSPLLIPAIIVIAAAQSRKALIIILAGAALTFFFYHIDKTQIIRSSALFIAFLFVFFLLMRFLEEMPIFSGIMKRMSFLENYITGDGEVGLSVYKRDEMIKIGWEQFLRTPILGIGFWNSFLLRQKYMSVAGSSLHNNYIELLACGGIMGFSAYYSRYVYLLYNLFRYRSVYYKDEYKQCLILIIICLIIEYAHVNYYVKHNQIFYVLLFLQIKFIRQQEVFSSTNTIHNKQSIYIKV